MSSYLFQLIYCWFTLFQSDLTLLEVIFWHHKVSNLNCLPLTYFIQFTLWFSLTFTILTSITPEPSVEPPFELPLLPFAKAQLPAVTQMQTPVVLLLTMKVVWAKAAVFFIWPIKDKDDSLTEITAALGLETRELVKLCDPKLSKMSIDKIHCYFLQSLGWKGKIKKKTMKFKDDWKFALSNLIRTSIFTSNFTP